MNNETNVIPEDQLDSIAGGGLEANGNCYFKPAGVFEKKVFDGETWIKCGSTCKGMFGANCSCFGTPRCSDSYHRVEKLSGDTWGPAPKNVNNHEAGDKQLLMQ